MSDGTSGDQNREKYSEDYSREAFMAAIVKLADDEVFRRSFLEHYQLWQHPPIIATPDMADIAWNMQPGGITFVTDEQMAALRGQAMSAFEYTNEVVRNLNKTP